MVIDEVAAAHARKDLLLANIVEVEGPLNTKCWEWQRALFTAGYGHIRHNNYDYSTHRLFYILHFGHIPEGLYCLHRCDAPACCNPQHLWLGTQQDNVTRFRDERSLLEWQYHTNQ